MVSFAVNNQDVLSTFVALAPVPHPKAFEFANNKWLLSRFLEEKHLPSPPTILATSDASFETDLERIEFPVLLKPVAAWGGEGIERFEDRAALRGYLKAQDAERIKERFIVQSLLPGFVVGFVVSGNNVTIKGLSFLGIPGAGNDPSPSQYAVALGNRGGNDFHLSGCWVGVGPDGTTVTGLKCGVTGFRHRTPTDVLTDRAVIGVKKGATNPRAEFNVMVQATNPIIIDGAETVFLGTLSVCCQTGCRG